MSTTHFPGFGYEAAMLSAYLFTIDIFIISLKGGELVRHTPDDAAAFRAWLDKHGIRDLTDKTPRNTLIIKRETPNP